jgi:hypothetical protein
MHAGSWGEESLPLGATAKGHRVVCDHWCTGPKQMPSIYPEGGCSVHCMYGRQQRVTAATSHALVLRMLTHCGCLHCTARTLTRHVWTPAFNTCQGWCSCIYVLNITTFTRHFRRAPYAMVFNEQSLLLNQPGVAVLCRELQRIMNECDLDGNHMLDFQVCLYQGMLHESRWRT